MHIVLECDVSISPISAHAQPGEDVIPPLVLLPALIISGITCWFQWLGNEILIVSAPVLLIDLTYRYIV